jgi:hypothetical protein
MLVLIHSRPGAELKARYTSDRKLVVVSAADDFLL